MSGAAAGDLIPWASYKRAGQFVVGDVADVSPDRMGRRAQNPNEVRAAVPLPLPQHCSPSGLNVRVPSEGRRKLIQRYKKLGRQGARAVRHQTSEKPALLLLNILAASYQPRCPEVLAV